MFDADRWQELWGTLRKNKLRTALTSLAVAWGIFMLVILLGAGTGLRHGVAYTFRDDAVNSLWFFPGKTSLPFEGHPRGRRVRLTNGDYERFKQALPGVDKISSRFYPKDSTFVSYGAKSAAFDIRAVHPDHQFLENTEVVEGRFLDDFDLSEKRKVAVVGIEVEKILAPGRKLLGERVAIGGIPHLVVGIFQDQGNEDERRLLYVPITTAQTAWHGGERIDRLMFTVGDASPETAEKISKEAVRMLAQSLRFDPKDKDAVRVRNNLEKFRQVSGVMDGISMFIWIVGLGTIVAGIVGVSNIMLISVKERTKEIGLRKALGATPTSIVAMILFEAVLITGAAGYLGLVAGIGVLEVARSAIPASDYFREPEVSLRLALTAMAILVAAGALAGFFPARRAARVNPVVALRDE